MPCTGKCPFSGEAFLKRSSFAGRAASLELMVTGLIAERQSLRRPGASERSCASRWRRRFDAEGSAAMRVAVRPSNPKARIVVRCCAERLILPFEGPMPSNGSSWVSYARTRSAATVVESPSVDTTTKNLQSSTRNIAECSPTPLRAPLAADVGGGRRSRWPVAMAS
jgi:hypothetical protein